MLKKRKNGTKQNKISTPFRNLISYLLGQANPESQTHSQLLCQEQIVPWSCACSSTFRRALQTPTYPKSMCVSTYFILNLFSIREICWSDKASAKYMMDFNVCVWWWGILCAFKFEQQCSEVEGNCLLHFLYLYRKNRI